MNMTTSINKPAKLDTASPIIDPNSTPKNPPTQLRIMMNGAINVSTIAIGIALMELSILDPKSMSEFHISIKLFVALIIASTPNTIQPIGVTAFPMSPINLAKLPPNDLTNINESSSQLAAISPVFPNFSIAINTFTIQSSMFLNVDTIPPKTTPANLDCLIQEVKDRAIPWDQPLIVFPIFVTLTPKADKIF